MNTYERDFIVAHKMAQYLFEAAQDRLVRPERDEEETTVKQGRSLGRFVTRQVAVLFGRSAGTELSA